MSLCLIDYLPLKAERQKDELWRASSAADLEIEAIARLTNLSFVSVNIVSYKKMEENKINVIFF